MATASTERKDAFGRIEAAWARGTMPNASTAEREAAMGMMLEALENFGKAVWNEAKVAVGASDWPPFPPTNAPDVNNPYRTMPLPAPYPTPEERGQYGPRMEEERARSAVRPVSVLMPGKRVRPWVP